MLINEIITEAPSKGPRISGAKDLTKEFLIDDPVSGGKYKWRPTRGVFIDARNKTQEGCFSGPIVTN